MTTARRTAGATPAKILGTLAAVALVGVLGVAGTTAALSDTTDSGANEFDASEIELADNDVGSFLYDVDNQEPGEYVERCIQVSYTGTTDSKVALFMDGAAIGAVGPFVDMTVDVGTQTTVAFPDCAGFTPVENLYTGTLAGFRTAHGTAAAGVVYGPRTGDRWDGGDSVVYKVRLELSHDARPVGANFSGPHTYTWRAETL